MSVKDKAAAIDRFVRTIKASGVYDDIKAACIMAGWTNLAGALYPLKGAAPTNNGFLATDYEPSLGLTGDGSSYVDTNRSVTADPQNDTHVASYCSANGGVSVASIPNTTTGATVLNHNAGGISGRLRNTTFTTGTIPSYLGFAGFSRNSSSGFTARASSDSEFLTATSATYPFSGNLSVFNFLGITFSTATISYYSIGTATDLAALDSAVSTLMADLRAIDEDGFDASALAYIRAVEAADGSLLESGVKQAINAFVVGCKKDGIWNAIKASCIMCGARTISGALVPLAGTAPTPYNFAGGDYSRTTGLKGDGATKYLDSNRANDADGQDDCHQSVYCSSINTLATAFVGNVDRSVPESGSFILLRGTGTILARINANDNSESAATFSGSGFLGITRSSSSSQTLRSDGGDLTDDYASTFLNTRSNFVFARDDSDGTPDYTDARLAFYSIGSALDLAALDNRVSTLVAAIAAAI